MVGLGVEHADAPIQTGMWALVRADLQVQASLICANPNGSGTKFTEVRQINIGGSIPVAVVRRMAVKLVSENYDYWKQIFAERAI